MKKWFLFTVLSEHKKFYLNFTLSFLFTPKTNFLQLRHWRNVARSQLEVANVARRHFVLGYYAALIKQARLSEHAKLYYSN